MKVLKKVSILLGGFIFVSCTSLNTTNSLRTITDILGMDNTVTEEKVTEIVKQDEFTQEEVVLINENVGKYLDIVKERLKKSEKRVIDNVQDEYKVLVGEYLFVPVGNGNSVRVVSSPKNTNTRARVENGNLVFRTIYRGNYGLSIYHGANLIRKINVVATTKFNFSESNIYDIITENSQKKDRTLEDAISLYKIYYPNGVNIRKVNYLLLDYGYTIKNNTIINEALDALKSEIVNFNDEEKILIVKAAKFVNKDIFIPAALYKTTNTALEKELTTYVKEKAILDKKDVEFLEKASGNLSSSEKTETLEKVSSWYKNNGDITKANNIANQTTNTKIENLYDIALKNMNTNPKLAIDNFKKSLGKERDPNKRAETYYNIANSYLKLGNKFEALKYLKLIKQEFVSNEWVQKSDKLINTIK